MLIPQFSIRWLLLLTLACAAVFSIFGLAAQGTVWAAAATAAIVSLAVVFAVHILLFVAVWLIAQALPDAPEPQCSPPDVVLAESAEEPIVLE